MKLSKRCLTVMILWIGVIVLFITLHDMVITTNGEENKTETPTAIQQLSDETKQADEDDLKDRINEYLQTHQIAQKDIAIAVHDFESGKSYTWNDEADFIAASLYKLPLAMLYYDRIHQNQLSCNDTFQYLSMHYEPGGVIGDTYALGTWVDVSTLLKEVILHSDNTAGHILFENLGGWLSFHRQSIRYIKREIQPSYFTNENITTAGYMNDILEYLYMHKDAYPELLNDLSEAMPYQYLNLELPFCAAQKYGWYGNAVHAAGIVLQDHPYSIVILTALGEAGQTHIGAIHRIVHEYFQESSLLHDEHMK